LLNILEILKIKNFARSSSSIVILFKLFKPSAIAFAPSYEIWFLEKIFYMFNYYYKYISSFKIKNLGNKSSSDLILFKFFKPSPMALAPSSEILFL